LLLPGSNYLVKDIDNDELILHIKEDARRDLERQLSHNTTDHELSEFLKTPEYFRFQSIRNDGKKEIFHDEYKRYRNLGLYKPTLALVKTRKQDKKTRIRTSMHPSSDIQYRIPHRRNRRKNRTLRKNRKNQSKLHFTRRLRRQTTRSTPGNPNSSEATGYL